MRSKAEFKALRELVGLTQKALADRLGVIVITIARWESDHPKDYYNPPQEAWELLDSAVARQQEVVNFAIQKVKDLEAEIGKKPKGITLTYWLKEKDYLAYSTDVANDIAGDWHMANANSRVVASALLSMGYTIFWVDGRGERLKDEDINSQ